MANQENYPSECDILIIGTGVGGAMAACNLAGTGAKVVLLERGYWRHEDGWLKNGNKDEDEEFAFKTVLNREADSADKNYSSVSFDGGTTFQKHKIGTSINAVGGYSVIYAGTFWRFRKEDFKKSQYKKKFDELNKIEDAKTNHKLPPVDLSDWSSKDFYDELEPFYCQAEKIMGVSGTWESDPMTKDKQLDFEYQKLSISENNFLPPLPLHRSNEIIAKAAKDLKWNPFPIPMGMSSIFNPNNEKMYPCVSCNFCSSYPCFWHSKNSVDETVLEKLDKLSNVKIITGATVRKLIHSNNKCEGVLFTPNNNPFELNRINAKVVILAAGAIQSPRILLLSDSEREIYKSKSLGKYLMFHADEKKGVFLRGDQLLQESIHYMAKKLAVMDFYTSAKSEKLTEYPYINHFSIQAGSKAGIIEFAKNIASAPDIKAYDPKEFMKDYKSYYEVQTIVEDLPQQTNRVELDFENLDEFGDPVAKVIHKFHPLDVRATDKGLEKIKELLLKANGKTKLDADFKDILKKGKPNGSHLMGTLRIGATPENSFVNSDCRSFDVSNLFIADGSTFTTSAGLNPALTIAAIGLRVGNFIKNNFKEFNIQISTEKK